MELANQFILLWYACSSLVSEWRSAPVGGYY